MDENNEADSAGRSGLTRRVLTIAGMFVAGLVAGDVAKGKKGRIRRLSDRILRGLLFQSKHESRRTESRTASSLIAETIHALYVRLLTHNIPSVAASSAFFMVLAIFPGLAALVALYSFLGDPAEISVFISTMPDIIPEDIVRLIQSFLQQLMLRPHTNLSTFIIGFVIALWSANSAMKSLIESLNVVYERREKRSFFRINIMATVMTLSFIGFMIVAVNIMLLPVWNALPRTVGDPILRVRWLIVLLAVQVLISALYYFAPCGRQRNWQLLTAGAGVAALAWVLMSMVFSLYLTSFANYSVTYGSLGAAAIFMTWLWLTVTILLTGAEVDAAIEHLGDNHE